MPTLGMRVVGITISSPICRASLKATSMAMVVVVLRMGVRVAHSWGTLLISLLTGFTAKLVEIVTLLLFVMARWFWSNTTLMIQPRF